MVVTFPPLLVNKKVANLSNQTGSPHMSQRNFFELDNEVWFDAIVWLESIKSFRKKGICL